MLEIMIAMAIAIISISGVLLATGAGGGSNQAIGVNQDIIVGGETNKEAQDRAQAVLEKAQADAKIDYDALASTAVTSDGIYSYNLIVTPNAGNPDIKLLTSVVSWTLGGRTLSVRLNSLATNPSGGAKCSPTLSGDWTNPVVLGTADIGQNDGATDLIIDDKKVYATASPSAAGKPTFYIVDVSNPVAAPLPILRSLDTLARLNAVYVSGDYAFVASQDNSRQLQIIDISNAASAVVVREFGVGSLGQGKSVYVKDNLLYLGLQSAGGQPELRVIDIGGFLSNPTTGAITEVGQWAAGADVNKITMKKDGTLIVATGYGSGPTNVYALNVTNVSGITSLGNFTASDNAASTMSGLYVTLNRDEDRIYLGRSAGFSGGGVMDPEFYVLNSDPVQLSTPMASRYVGTSDVNAATVRGNLAFLVTSDASSELKIYDMNNLSGPLHGSLNMQASPTGGFDCLGNLLYIAQRSSEAIQIVGPAPDYTLVSGGNVTVQRGSSVSNTITAILVGGYAPQTTFATIGALPAGVSVAFANNPCTPTCASTMTINTTAATPLGAHTITVNALPASVSGTPATFVLTVVPVPPTFNYTLSNPATLVLKKGDPAVAVIETVTMVAGATPQLVTLTPPNPQLASITVTAPFGNSCTPDVNSPYTCTVTFMYSAAASAPNSNDDNQTFTGSPLGVQNTGFRIRVTP